MRNRGCMSAGTIGIALLVIAAILFFWGKNGYNSFTTKEQNVNTKWSNVETVYQKRANLIPNLERTVKSYSQFEQETLTKVIEARSKATSMTIDPTNMTEADMAKFQAAQGELSGALSRLMAVVEQYPNYNTSIKTFPNNILANFTNFKEKPYFKAAAGAEKAPEVFTN